MNQSPIQDAITDRLLIIGPLNPVLCTNQLLKQFSSFQSPTKPNLSTQVINIYKNVQYMSMEIIKFQCFEIKKLHCANYSQLIIPKLSVTAK